MAIYCSRGLPDNTLHETNQQRHCHDIDETTDPANIQLHLRNNRAAATIQRRMVMNTTKSIERHEPATINLHRTNHHKHDDVTLLATSTPTAHERESNIPWYCEIIDNTTGYAARAHCAADLALRTNTKARMVGQHDCHEQESFTGLRAYLL